MRKLIESTLVSLDGVVEAPEQWANFDAEDAAFATERLRSYDAFVMGRGTYENFFANWGHTSGDPYIDLINAMPKHVAPRDRPVEGKAWEGPHQVRDEPPRRHARAKPPHRRVPLLDQARRSRGRATTVPRRGHLGARPETVRPDNAGERFSDPHLSASLKAAKMLTWALFLPVGMLVRAISLKGWRPLAWRRPRRSGRDLNPYSGSRQPTRHKWVENAAIVAIPHGGPHTTGAGFR